MNHPDDCHIGDVKFGKASLLTIAGRHAQIRQNGFKLTAPGRSTAGCSFCHYHEQSQMGLSEDLL